MPPRPTEHYQSSHPQELPGSKEHPIFHKPGSIKVSSVKDLLKLYANSFDRLGSLKGEYDIKVDPTVQPVQHVRRKVPTESKAAIEEAIDYMSQDLTFLYPMRSQASLLGRFGGSLPYRVLRAPERCLPPTASGPLHYACGWSHLCDHMHAYCGAPKTPYKSGRFGQVSQSVSGS